MARAVNHVLLHQARSLTYLNRVEFHRQISPHDQFTKILSMSHQPTPTGLSHVKYHHHIQCLGPRLFPTNAREEVEAKMASRDSPRVIVFVQVPCTQHRNRETIRTGLIPLTSSVTVVFKSRPRLYILFIPLFAVHWPYPRPHHSLCISFSRCLCRWAVLP